MRIALHQKETGIQMKRTLRITIVARQQPTSSPSNRFEEKKFTLDKRFNFNDLLGSASAFITIYNYLQLPYN